MPSKIATCIQDLTADKPRAEVETHTHLSLRNDYIYFQVSKSASSTVKHHLQAAEYEGTHFRVQNVNNKYLSPHLSPFQVKERDFIAMLHDPAIRKVTFVRNPFARILSCYLHRIAGGPSPSRKKLYRVMRLEDSAEVSFGDFVETICGQSSHDMDNHWRVQADDVLWDYVDFDFVGKLETLTTDLLALEALLFGREIFDRHELASLNLAPKRTDAGEKLRSFYTKRLIARVAERYQRDFMIFGYEPDLPS